jgi:hypothetical protein
MPEPTTTTDTTTRAGSADPQLSENGNLSPAGGFTFTLHGAVAELVNPKRVPVPANVREILANAVKYFDLATTKSTDKAEINLPTPELAEEFRAQIISYSDETGVSEYLPKFVDEHESTRTVKGADGQPVMGQDGKPLRETYTVPANGRMTATGWKGAQKHWNVGTNVTFRITTRKQSNDETPAVDTATVTVTQRAPRPSAPRSRGAQILGR